MRSCTRPRCVPDASAQCQAGRNPTSVTEVAPPVVAATELVPVSETEAIGVVQDVRGQVRVVRTNGGHVETSRPVIQDMQLQRQDRLETEDRSSVRITLRDHSVLTLGPRSKMELTHLGQQDPQDRHSKEPSTVSLLMGKLRAYVKPRPASETDVFRVRTPAAVAGVRGTEFVTLIPPDNSQKTEVFTLSGLVALKAPGGDEHLVSKGIKMSVQNSGTGPNTMSFFSMPQSLRPDELSELGTWSAAGAPSTSSSKAVTHPAPERRVASVERKRAVVCSLPAADVGECSIRCSGKGKGSCGEGASRCEIRRCGAQGQWVDERFLPTHFNSTCPKLGESARLAPCDSM